MLNQLFPSLLTLRLKRYASGVRWTETQSLEKNRELRQLIRQTLNKDEKALAKLNDFWCGGGAGCYDLGFIVTQIIYRLGDKDFTEMVAKLDENELTGLEGLIMAGLEYGDNDKDGKMDNKKIDTEFPELLKQIETNRQLKKPNH
ncbi:MAG: hypothetical protein EOO46_14530 [Flavobacterium sp.]|nr:MAG: hypothetical protein EOO46_14530 [Flavobacterium sp.]